MLSRRLSEDTNYRTFRAKALLTPFVEAVSLCIECLYLIGPDERARVIINFKTSGYCLGCSHWRQKP